MITGIPINEDFSYANPNENTELFIIIQHTSNEDFLTQLANKLLDYPCRDFNFYGESGYRGEAIFDSVDTERGYIEENVALTSCYHDLKRLAKRLYIGVKINRHDILILYDDVEIYHRLLIFARKLFPWWQRRMIPKADKRFLQSI